MTIETINKSKPYNFKDIFTYELLHDLYIVQKLTSRQIAKMYNISKGKVLNDLKKFNITYQDQFDDYKISELQHDLIIGSHLGDGTFLSDGGDYRMSFRHAENQKEYLFFKFETMKEFCKKKTTGTTDWNKKLSDNAQTMHYFHTRALSVFNKYKNMSNVEALEALNQNSFAIWLMDDGSFYSKNYPKYTPYYTLSCKRFSKKEAELTKYLLKDRFNIECNINDMHKDYYNNGKNYEVSGLYFPTSETYKIIDLVLNSDFGNILKETMSYKLIPH